MSRTPLSFALLLLLPEVAPAQDLQPLMGRPVPGLTATEMDLFLKGLIVFNRALTEAEGLGPIFNEPACASCHNHPAAGGSSTRNVTRFGKIGPPFDPLADLGGSLLQDQSLDIACREVVPPEADVVSQRKTPICFGGGLLDAILDADIVANEANQPPHLNGFVSWVGNPAKPKDPLRPAHFGWKGDALAPISFSIGAGLNEMGLTSRFAPNENAPNGDQNLLDQCDTVSDPEDRPDAFGITKVEHWTNFQRPLAPPPQTPKSGMTGELLFDQIGCVDCHRRGYVTGIAPEAALSNVPIQPYSNFLIHDMGSLGDGIGQANAAPTEMFTRALWGLAVRTSFMHDGRVTGMTLHDMMIACVQEHDGEGDTARQAFNALSTTDQDLLIDFLQSLGQAEFDFELDNDLDEFDWFFIEPALSGPVPSYTPDDPEAINDVDADGDFDIVEFGLFQRGFTGQTAGLTMPARPVSTELILSIDSGGNTVYVAPGGSVRYEVLGRLSNGKTGGLAMFAFDLHFDGGPLVPADFPNRPPMDHFATDGAVHTLGLNNPQGFGGSVLGGDLIQVGGAQNTIKNTFAPHPSGPVITDVARHKGGQIPLVAGSFTAPAATGQYDLTLSNLMANALEKSSTGTPFWRVVPLEMGAHRDLRVVVDACAPLIYCDAKVSSAGVQPKMQWRGFPSTTGTDDFHLYATDVMGNEMGLFLFSLTQANTPFFGGTLCVGGALQRTRATVSSGTTGVSDGRIDFHMRQSFMAKRGLVAGDTVFAQCWFRDPAHLDGTGVGLTDAIQFTLCP